MNIDESFYLKRVINAFRELKRVVNLYDEYIGADSMFPPEDEIYGKEIYTLRRIKEDSRPKAMDIRNFIQDRLPGLKKRKLSEYLGTSNYNYSETYIRRSCKLKEWLENARELEGIIYEYVDTKSIALQNKQEYEELHKNG